MNAGLIMGSRFYGVAPQSCGVVTKLAEATMSGLSHGISSGGIGTVTNAGVIEGTNRYGVWLRGTGRVVNLSAGMIVGADAGISLAGTIVNEGTIGGGTEAVEMTGGSSNRLILGAGTVDGGNTAGGAAVSTLELASYTSVGQISGLGSKFTDFAQVAVDTGARTLWRREPQSPVTAR